MIHPDSVDTKRERKASDLFLKINFTEWVLCNLITLYTHTQNAHEYIAHEVTYAGKPEEATIGQQQSHFVFGHQVKLRGDQVPRLDSYSLFKFKC